MISLSAPATAEILVGTNFPITTAQTFQDAPAVAVHPVSGEFLVVWHAERVSEDSGLDVYGQRLAADGARIGPPFPVSTRGGANPAVTFNSSLNEFLVVYDRGGIFGQRVSVDGFLIGGEFFIVTPRSPADAAVAYDGVTNQYLAVWAQGTGGVRGRIVTAEGLPVTAVFELSAGLDGAQRPAVVFNAVAQQYFVTWDTLLWPDPSCPPACRGPR
jgi:hypothetical protein